jgi:DMSO/TMAO reductase YedYZ molybdopterin-dependent catalytic subunit
MEHPRGTRRRSRRELLKMVPLACAGMLVHANSREWILDAGLRMTDAASALTFRPSVLAPTFADKNVTPFHDFPINSYLTGDFEVDLDTWRLDVSGLVQHQGAYTLDSIRGFPKVVQNTRHICIEGWDVIGNFAGTRVDDFLTRIDADRSAKFLEVNVPMTITNRSTWLALDTLSRCSATRCTGNPSLASTGPHSGW